MFKKVDEWFERRHAAIVSRGGEPARRLNRNLGIVAEDATDREFYGEIEAIRSKARVIFWICVTLGGYNVVRSALRFEFPGNVIAVVFSAALLWFMVRYPAHMLRRAHWMFYRRRIVPYQYHRKTEYPELTVYVPKLRVFRRAADLRKLERDFIEGVKRDIERIERKRKLRRWDARNEDLREEMLQEVRGSALLLPRKTAIEEKVLEVWELLPKNPDRRKKYVQKVRYFVIGEVNKSRFRPVPISAVPQMVQVEPDTDEHDPRIRFLEAEAQECSSPKAVALRTEARQTPDRRAKIRLLKQAIREERSMEEADETPSEPRIEVATSKKETRFIVLDELMENSFNVNEHFLPPGMDPVMVKEILLELLDPGSGQRRFQAAYRPETTLRRRVRQRYEAWAGGQCDPRMYQWALDWLVREGVLRSKPKPKDRYVYSLSANMQEAKSDGARELIQAVIRLNHEIRSM
jgi:hypothetical protein